MERGTSYFETVILPLVGLPFKISYNLKESCKILDITYTTLGRLVQKGLIKITTHKRIYATEFIRFFEEEHTVNVPDNVENLKHCRS